MAKKRFYATDPTASSILTPQYWREKKKTITSYTNETMKNKFNNRSFKVQINVIHKIIHELINKVKGISIKNFKTDIILI